MHGASPKNGTCPPNGDVHHIVRVPVLDPRDEGNPPVARSPARLDILLPFGLGETAAVLGHEHDGVAAASECPRDAAQRPRSII